MIPRPDLRGAVPRGLQERSLRAERTAETLARALGRRPTVEELADDLACTQEDVLEALEAATAHRATSLDGRALPARPV